MRSPALGRARPRGPVARAGTTDKTAGVDDIAKELVDLKLETLDIKASIKVLQTGEDLIGTFLDEFA